MSDRPVRAPKPQIVLEVIRREQLSPHLVRLYLGGDGFASFVNNDLTDRYVKIFFAHPELGLQPPYDMAALRERLTRDELPVTRTYTVREVNDAEQWLSIDFVVHGDEGLAAPWAARAEPGDRIAFTGPGGGYRPNPEADWHLLAGDESALPAIGAALEAMPEEAIGVAFIEVGGADDQIALSAPAGIDIRWLHRGAAPAGSSSILADTVAAFEWMPGQVQVFAHGERESMKALREVFFGQRGLDRGQVSLSGYWAYGRTEDRFQAEKREPIGQILAP
ncbi:NADPH-dependent ferric siderophore reductase [Homoserinimonas aerilata]|uniref:NADPH-dependent ferric siderophore reductase n=1 Tax=Homoserinimonas aerilata TaxID=1162970 RepID=A0A542YAC5_9MICO|nr:siderophore-interacting protein [Homoserinimonas aerilata]TQL45051.1 NADPH-dependent ferric siderophore reductase [Homoserinimonas aerilata]